MKRILTFAFLLFTLPLMAVRYATIDQGLNQLFTEEDTQFEKIWGTYEDIPTAIFEKLKLLKSLRGARFEGEFNLYRVTNTTGDLQGWAIITEEISKHQPMTFLVAIKNDESVLGTLLLVFRESRGWGVKQKRFQKQFKNKNLTDPIKVRRDIVHVSGSTISSRAMARGVRKSLHMVNLLQQNIEKLAQQKNKNTEMK